jgi:DNA replication licensing factor MCM6
VCHVALVAGEGGVQRSQLVDWYLKEIEADIEDTEELVAKKILVEKIVERLVHHVSVT